MAEIIGYDKRVIKRFRAICPKCGAIIIFDSDEIQDRYQYNDYVYSKGICPGCGYDGVSLDKHKDQYEEPTKEFYGWPPNVTNCIRKCTECKMKCLYRKEEFIESALDK